MVALNVILNKDFGRRTELIGRWPINIGAAPKTRTDMKNDRSI